MIKNLKTVYYRKEASFGESYDPANAYNEIKVSELTTNRVSEKLETKYLNANRELNNTTSTGKVTGKLTATKPLDGSFFNDHLDLTQVAFGKLVQALGNDTAGVVTAVTDSSTIDVTDGAYFAVGDIVQIGAVGTEIKTAVNKVKAVSTNTITLEYPMTDENKAKITTGTDRLIKAPVFSPAEVNNETFTFVVVYDDDSVDVLTGASASMSFDLNREGKLDMKIEVQSATIASEDSTGNALVKPTGTITNEGDYKSLYVDFDLTYVYDVTTADKKAVCPYNFALKLAHALTPIKSLCGLNGISGFYSKADITAEIEYARTPANLITFSSKNEANENNFLWLSQITLALIAEKARLTNLDTGYTDEFDNIKLNADVNFSTTDKFLVVLAY